MNEKQMNQQVYAVCGGYDYEGCDFESLKLFDCKSTAIQYQNRLEEFWNYDYVNFTVKTIEMKSAIQELVNV